MKLSITGSSINVTADWVTFTEEIRNGILHFLCSDSRILLLLSFWLETTKNDSHLQVSFTSCH